MGPLNLWFGSLSIIVRLILFLLLLRNVLICLEYYLNAYNHILQCKVYRHAIYIHVLVLLPCMESVRNDLSSPPLE